jgi:hypothetical protein
MSFALGSEMHEYCSGNLFTSLSSQFEMGFLVILSQSTSGFSRPPMNSFHLLFSGSRSLVFLNVRFHPFADCSALFGNDCLFTIVQVLPVKSRSVQQVFETFPEDRFMHNDILVCMSLDKPVYPVFLEDNKCECSTGMGDGVT